MHPGVFRLAGMPLSWEQRVMAACLWGGESSAASHRAAAALWKLDGVERDVIEITASRRLRAAGVIVHNGVFSPREVTSIGPIPVTTVDRTLLDLGAVVAESLVEAAVTDALRRGLTSQTRLMACLARSGGRGRRGAKVLRAILDSFNGSMPESVLEARLLRLLRRHHLPQPTSQYQLREAGRVVARIDFAYPEVKVAIEADGYRYHAGIQAWRRDRARRNELTARGWRVLHVAWADLEERPGEVIAGIRRALTSGREVPARHAGPP